MHSLLSLVFVLLLALGSDRVLAVSRGLLQNRTPEEERALDNLSTAFAGVSSDAYFGSSRSLTPPLPPTPPPPPSYSPSPPAPTTAPTGARFTPAPVVFDKLNLPTYSKISQSSGPVSPDALTAAAPSGACKSLKEILSSIPQVSQWLDLLKSVGYESILLEATSLQVTLFVPVTSAFTAGIDAQPLRKEKTVQELISNAPDVRTPLAGYSVVRGLWPSSTLNPGTTLPTANSIDKVNPLNIKVRSSTQLQGIGDDATILQADVAACGPSIVNSIDQILLPFKFDQGPTDAITGTQVAKDSSSSGPAG